MARSMAAGLAAAALCLGGCGLGRAKAPDLGAKPAIVAGAIVAWAWGGAAGYRGEDQYDVRVAFRPEPGVTAYHILACEPKTSPCDSLPLFESLGIKFRPTAGGLLLEFRTGIEEEDRHLVVIGERDGELLASETIVATVASRPTEYAAGGLRFDPATLQFSWPRVPDAGRYVLAVIDTRAKTAVAVATRRKRWSYPEIQGIVQHFHDPAAVHDLEAGREYDAALFAVDARHWTTMITDATVKP